MSEPDHNGEDERRGCDVNLSAMLTLLVGISGTLVIMSIVADVNRRRDSLTYSPRTSGSDDGASSWVQQ